MKKIVFFGTPEFAAEIFDHLLQNHTPIVGVVTQPDRPKGRALQLTPSAVKKKCPPEIPLFQPNRCSEALFLEALRNLEADLYVVVSFGQILPQKLLDIPPMGCINIHPSLLPKYRGATPIRRALMNGDAETGVCIQKMVWEMDAGDLVAETRIPLPLHMNHGELEKELCQISKVLLMEVLGKFQAGVPDGKSQDRALVTFAPKLSPEEMKIDWTRSALEIHNQVRGLAPQPGAWCLMEMGGESKRLKILRSELVEQEGTPGELLSRKQFIIGCGKKALRLLEVQPEGKARMSGDEWLRGLRALPTFL